jgi:hypothetical protein
MKRPQSQSVAAKTDRLREENLLAARINLEDPNRYGPGMTTWARMVTKQPFDRLSQTSLVHSQKHP